MLASCFSTMAGPIEPGDDDAWTEEKPKFPISPAKHQKTGLFDFSNSQAIKEKVRDQTVKSAGYSVKNFYKKKGFFSWLAAHPVFENTTLAIISLNAVWIGIDTDYNTADTLVDAGPAFITADVFFLSYFTIELFVRFMAFERKCNCMKDAWFVFDSALVLMYWFDPVVLSIIAATGGAGLNLPTSILRLLRLARLSRLVRLLRSLPELLILVKGMVIALSTVTYTLGMLIVLAYVFAIALTQLSNGCEFRELYFTCVPHGMFSLIIFATYLDDLAAFGDPIKAESTMCLILVVIYIILASLTVMNMLIGVLCEVIDGVAVVEKESMMVEKVHEAFGEIINRLDTDTNGVISWTEFKQLLEDPVISHDAVKAFESCNVDVDGLIDVAEEYFFYMGEPVELTFADFMAMVLELRGGQKCIVKDVILLRKRFNRKFYDVKERLGQMTKKLDFIISKPRP